MLARIAQAYRQFSYFSSNVSQTSRTGAHKSDAVRYRPNQESGGQDKQNQARERKITQLRDTGTLKKLQKILNESEELLISKLFDNNSSQSVVSGNTGAKGQRLDGRY